MLKKANENTAAEPKKAEANQKPVDPKKVKQQREAEQFKRKYFDFYDDIKISVKEDW